MGDTAPAQALGILGGGGGGGGSMATPAAAPRVHSAIVERLRARIAICRQHHLNCAGRYERGRAESSDRERESTLQLLNLVQHGQAARKGSKHSKAAAGSNAAAAPPRTGEYYHQQLISNGSAGGRNGINGEPPSLPSGGELRNPALIAVDIKRRGWQCKSWTDGVLDAAKMCLQMLSCAEVAFWRVDGARVTEYNQF